MSIKYILGVLFPYIVLLYLVDCIVYIKKNRFLFVSRFRRYFKLKKSGLRLVGILPIDKVVISQDLPVYFTTNGIYIQRNKDCLNNVIAEIKDLDFISYGDISYIQIEGKNVRINKSKIINTACSNVAKQYVDFLKELMVLEVSERREKIREFLENATDLKEIRNITSIYLNYSHYLQILCSTLFICTFIVIPLTLYSHLYLYISMFSLLFYMACVYLMTFMVAYLAVRRLYKPVSVNLGTILSMFLSPITAVHVLSNLAREIYLPYDYLAVAAELMPGDKFKYLISSEFERIAIFKDSCSRDDLKEYFFLKEICLGDLAAKLGIRMKEIMASPEKRDRWADCYCPVCRAEYRVGFRECSDCGVTLKRFSPDHS